LNQDKEQKTTQTLGKGLLIIIWITSIFMVMIMNDIKSQLEQINSKLTSTTRALYANDPARMQIVDAKDGKTVLYTVERVPDPEDDMMDESAEGEEATTKPDAE
tara:strand:- start:1663 stop:1974 length:312 start_codon:yes stop_codon:yes gene_type:complete